MPISFRKRATGFVAKLLVAMLVASFALWGIGDIFRDGSRQQVLANVDGEQITVNEYQKVLHLRELNIRQMLGDDYDPALKKQLGLERLILGEMIDFILLTKEADALGIAVSDKLIAKKISNMAYFRDDAGQFDKAQFQNMLRNMGMTEEYFLEKIRSETAASLLTDGFVGRHVIPDSLVERLYLAENETREATLYMFPQRLIENSDAPGDDVLDAYYHDHAPEFAAPEYRTLQYVILELDQMHKKTSVTESAVENYYNEHIGNYTSPETRDVMQLLYGSMEEAEKAQAMAQNQPFSDVAAQLPPLNANALALGKISREQLPEEARNTVFSMEKGSVSSPVQTAFGWHVFSVRDIRPQTTASLSSVREDITKALTAIQAEEELYQLANGLEDQLATGLSLKEAAGLLGVAVLSTPAIDRTGKTQSGEFISLPEYNNFLATAFAMEENAEPRLTPAEGKENTYFIVALEGITPEHVRPLEEVRAQVVSAWKKQDKQSRLKTLAEELAESMKTDRKAALKRLNELGVKSYNSGQLNRNSNALPSDAALPNLLISAGLVGDIFKIAPDESTAAHPLYNGDYAVAVLKETKFPALPAAQDKIGQAALTALREDLEKQYDNELRTQYLQYLRGKYAVHINEQLYQSITASE